MKVAYVLITCDLGYEEEVIKDIKHFESAKEVQGTFGAYDILVKVENMDYSNLRETIICNLRKIPHVRSTLTLMGIEGQE